MGWWFHNVNTPTTTTKTDYQHLSITIKVRSTPFLSARLLFGSNLGRFDGLIFAIFTTRNIRVLSIRENISTRNQSKMTLPNHVYAEINLSNVESLLAENVTAGGRYIPPVHMRSLIILRNILHYSSGKIREAKSRNSSYYLHLDKCRQK